MALFCLFSFSSSTFFNHQSLTADHNLSHRQQNSQQLPLRMSREDKVPVVDEFRINDDFHWNYVKRIKPN